MAEVVFSPFSNSALRDWPHFAELIGLFVTHTDLRLTVVGTSSQRAGIDDLLRAYPATRAVNAAGLLPWTDVLERIRSASLVVANNSGLAHLAAQLEVPTVCVFAASHSPYEWMARGRNTTVIFKETVCSPCSMDVYSNCPYGVRCLSEIDAGTVFDVCRARIGESVGNGDADAASQLVGPQFEPEPSLFCYSSWNPAVWSDDAVIDD